MNNSEVNENNFQSCLKCKHLSKRCRCKSRKYYPKVGKFKSTAETCNNYFEAHNNINASSYYKILGDGIAYRKMIEVWVEGRFLKRKVIHIFPTNHVI